MERDCGEDARSGHDSKQRDQAVGLPGSEDPEND
jgi:hypothetical protein